MSERLDLSGWTRLAGDVTILGRNKDGSEQFQSFNAVFSEALRAQASEDALRERVRVLEELLTKWRKQGEMFVKHGLVVKTDEAIGGGKESV